ncbi:MAG: hypothetical protein E7208_08505 [Clostridium butyricum]|nr:hypothetical protein [Clostridium butyricum]
MINKKQKKEMGIVVYNAIDLIDKCIDIENNKRKIFERFIDDRDSSVKLKIIAKVFLKNGDRIINYYNQLKNRVKNSELEEIDFRTYDKISFLINEYNLRIRSMNLDKISVREYLEILLELAKDKYSLFVDIQGRLYNNTTNNQGKTYELLSKIIEYTEYQVKIIEKTITKNEYHF